ncbi:two-component system response regulator AgrA [Enterococcus rivorum]|uniref:HTH LytTR-type domain-containing protein n=2 Tax=Enterococcus rivorum TaxID=762845 RepID=A0A1E5KY28_9ENTE|nr:LytTR family DNA-binding domain-containing protein [Enterococcus rivorum]MBP2099620.1 two-component system response regulator AgrA [Enterococcus rivorum]OEH82757.1 hypothetical protein BCR26_12000 [Enterococcus rivorum]
MRTAYIILNIGNKFIKLSLNKLLYISTVKKKEHLLCFVTQNETYYCKGSLKDYEKKSYPSLFRCHRSVIVNLQVIKEIDRTKKRIYFTDEKENNCIVSRRKLSELIVQWKFLAL